MHKGIGVLVLVILMTTPVFALDPKGDVEVGLERLSGHTTYAIGGGLRIDGEGPGQVHFPISELEFPLDAYLCSVEAGITFADAFRFGLGYKKSLSGEGTVKDSDWGYWWLNGRPWGRQETLDIYSESDGAVDALIWDGRLSYTWHHALSANQFGLDDLGVKFGLGYIRQRFDFEVTDLDQWYPSYPLYRNSIESDPTLPPATKAAVKGHILVPGKVLTYSVTYTFFPMLEVGAVAVFHQRFSLEGGLGYCPWVRAEDEDHHLLRDKVSEGDCDGTAFLGSLKIGYALSRSLTLGLSYDLITIETDGVQTQRAPDFAGEIDQTIESRQQYLGLNLGYRF